MAIDLGGTNTSRYHRVADDRKLTLPNSDWTWIAIVRPEIVSSAGYIISTDSYGAFNSFNLYSYDTALGVGCRVHSIGEVTTGVSLANDQWYIFHGGRRDGNVFVAVQGIDDTSIFNSNSGAALVSSYDTFNDVYIGSREDLTSTRFWRGQRSHVFFLPGISMPDEDMLSMAQGKPISSFEWYSEVTFHDEGETADTAAYTDLIWSHPITRFGSSYGTTVDEPPLIRTYPRRNMNRPFTAAFEDPPLGGFTPKGSPLVKPFYGPFGGAI